MEEAGAYPGPQLRIPKVTQILSLDPDRPIKNSAHSIRGEIHGIPSIFVSEYIERSGSELKNRVTIFSCLSLALGDLDSAGDSISFGSVTRHES